VKNTLFYLYFNLNFPTVGLHHFPPRLGGLPEDEQAPPEAQVRSQPGARAIWRWHPQ
jgi:hypothetical protein